MIGCLVLAHGQIERFYFYFRIMFFHVPAEAYLAVLLLPARYLSFKSLAHQQYGFFFPCYQHKHSCSEISALKGILPIERQWFQVRHVGIQQHERNVLPVELVCKSLRLLYRGRDQYYSVGLFFQTTATSFQISLGVQTAEVPQSYIQMEVAPEFDGFHCSQFYLFPIGFACMLGQYAAEDVVLVACQCTRIGVGLVVYFP